MADPSERPGLFRRLLKGSADDEKVRTARFPLQAYGKLPIYKDFISIGLTDPGAREFRPWLDRGFSYRWAENEEYRDAEIPPHGFLLRLPQSKSCVAGALWGSSDEGGLRRFPFTVFLSFPAAQPAADPLAAVHYLTAIERRGEEIRDGYAAGASLSAFYKAYRGAEFECALKTREQAGRELKSALGDFPVAEFAESLFGSRALSLWPGFVEAFEAAAARSNGPAAVRLPLGGLLPRSREIAVWLRWVDRLDPKRRRPVTGVLYTSGRGPGRAVLFFRDLLPEDFLLLHPTRGGHAHVMDIGTGESRRWGEAPPAPPAAVAETAAPPAGAGLAHEPAQPAAEPAAIEPLPEASAPPEAIVPGIPAEAPPEVSRTASPGEALPFPEAHAPEQPAAQGLRETFSALVVPVVDPALPGAPAGAAAQTQEGGDGAGAGTPDPGGPSPGPEAASGDSAPASLSPMPPAPPVESPPRTPEHSVEPPPGWDRPLAALLGL